jgi:hypothetical protein
MNNLHMTLCNSGIVAFDGNCSTGYYAFELLERWYNKNNRKLSISSKFGEIQLVDIKIVDDAIKAEKRYEKLRKLNPRQYAQLHQLSMQEFNFDELVDKFVIDSRGNVTIP